MHTPTYIAIDLKSFYASVECIERQLDPLTTHLVVADNSRTEKTICLAVSPSLKNYGISGRARLFEVVQKIKECNAKRKYEAPQHKLIGESSNAQELKSDTTLAISYIIAPPQMALYIEYSTRIYEIYLKYIAPEDIHVYSIDEVFIDATPYLGTYKLSPKELAMKIILDVLQSTGITATAGIGTNLYLSKIAMDIQAKHMAPDRNGVRIAILDEMSYRQNLWTHRPLTDFWRIGKGYTKKLEQNGLYTMGDIARCSIGATRDYHNEDLLYRLFGVNAELLIDHAWGWEPCTITDIKAYKPTTNSISSGQVLQYPYPFEKAVLVIREMTESLVLDLVDRKLATDQIVLTIGYDTENLKAPADRNSYKGEITIDHYGRKIPKHAHGTINLKEHTSSFQDIMPMVISLYNKILNPSLLIRRITIVANHVADGKNILNSPIANQIDLFSATTDEKVKEQISHSKEREKKQQEAILAIKKRYGKNALFKASDLTDGATALSRNNQIGGHKA